MDAGEEEPRSSACAGDPVASILEFAETLRVNATPTLYLENGGRVAGAINAQALGAKMDEARETLLFRAALRQ